MSIAKVIGVPWENIVKIGGIPKAAITNVGGVVVPPSVYCNTVEYGFSDGRTTPVTAACSASLGQYSEGSNGILYLNGFCGDGSNVAPDGFYSDGIQIYLVSGGVLTPAGSCPPTPTCDDMSFSFGEAPGIACSAGASFYSFDSTNNLLYNFGSCGGDYAPEGFYSNGVVVYWWHTVGRDLVWETIGPCG